MTSTDLPLHFEEHYYVVDPGGRPYEVLQPWMQAPAGTAGAQQIPGTPAGTWWVRGHDALADVDPTQLVTADAYRAAMELWTTHQDRQRQNLEDVVRANSAVAELRIEAARAELAALGLSDDTVTLLLGRR